MKRLGRMFHRMRSSRLRNGHARLRDRAQAAWWCLRGDSVIFSTRFVLSDDAPIRVTAMAPGRMLHCHSSFFKDNPECPAHGVQMVLGE